MPVEYAPVIEAEWRAVSPSSGSDLAAPVQRIYPVSSRANPGTVQYAIPNTAPRPTNGPSLDDLTYRDSTGARTWKPTSAERAWERELLRDYGPGSASVRNAARASDNAILQALPYAGDIAGGAVDGVGAYRRTGSALAGATVGSASTAGGLAGSAIGGVAGSALGPLGTLAGAAVGGALGQALGSSIANSFFPSAPDHNKNGATVNGDLPFTGAQCAGVGYYFYYETFSGGSWGERTPITIYGPVTSRSIVQISNDPRITRISVTGRNLSGQPLTASTDQGVPATNVRWTRNPRIDGLADTCGNPAPTQVIAPVTVVVSPIAPVAPTLPKPWPIPSPLPIPIPNPTYYPIPTPSPDPRVAPYPTPVPYPVPTPAPRPSPTPTDTTKPTGRDYPDPTQKPNPNPVNYPDPTADTGPCDPCKKLDIVIKKIDEIEPDGNGQECDLNPVIELLTTSIEGEINLPPCGDEEIQTYSAYGQGIDGLSEKLNILASALTQIWDKVKCADEAVSFAIPETWNLKRSVNIDQMIIITKKPDDKTSYRRSFTIPHPRYKALRDVSRIKRFTYKRGSCQATINLLDNSCCVLNCSTMTEAKRVVKYVLQLIDPDWAKSAKVNFTEKINMTIQPATVEFHRAEYFSSTDDRVLPDWAINIP